MFGVFLILIFVQIDFCKFEKSILCKPVTNIDLLYISPESFECEQCKDIGKLYTNILFARIGNGTKA